MTDDTAYAGRFEGKTHLLPVRVYYEDTDLSGVVYHAGYLRFLERGRSDFLRCVGVHHASLLEQQLAFAVTAISVKFAQAARIDDALVVRTRFTHVAGVRMFVSQEVLRDGRLLTSAEVEAVTIGLDGRAKRLPAEVRSRLEPWLSGRGTQHTE